MKASAYLKNPKEYLYEFSYRKRGKKRTFVTYNKGKNGEEFRKFHESFLLSLNKLPSSENSYAYKYNSCTKAALEKHMNSNLFIKLDIHSFFESITIDNFLDITKDLIKEFGEEDIRACFYDGHLTLGLVTSPKMSDIYLLGFDKKVEEYLKIFPSLKYSRYCDDILISTSEDSFAQLHTFESFITETLSDYYLTINKKKRREFDLSKDTSVHFLGLNIVNHENGRILTVSKDFIVRTLEIVEKINELKEESNKEGADIYSISYRIWKMRMCVDSRAAYIKNNSSYSYERFLKKYQSRFNRDWSERWL